MKTKLSILIICLSLGFLNSCGGGGSGGNEITPQCGNGITEAGEECDGESNCGTSCTLLDVSSGVETNCSDGVDNDGDGAADCDDTDCSADAACADGDGGEDGETACTGDDCDSGSDAADPAAEISPEDSSEQGNETAACPSVYL